MRIAITLLPYENETTLPLNYQYPFSGAIYRILSNASPEYAFRFYDKGYLTENGKPMELFVLFRLAIPKPERLFNELMIKNSAQCTLYISSPMTDEFVRHFVTGLNQDQDKGGPD